MRYSQLTATHSTHLSPQFMKLRLSTGLLWPDYMVAIDETDSRVFVARDDKRKVVGWLLMRPAAPRTRYGNAIGSPYNIELFVNPKFRRRGIGSHLLKMALIEWKALRKRNEPNMYFTADNLSRKVREKYGI